MGQFFLNAFRPRSRRGSTSSSNSSDSHILPVPPKTAPLIQTFAETMYTSGNRSSSNDVLPLVANSPISSSLATTSNKPPSHNHDKSRRRSPAGSPRSRKTSGSSFQATASLSPSNPSANIPPPLPPKDTLMVTPSRWRFLHFLSRDPAPTPTELTEPLTITADNTGPKKGDVLCLSYNTLDDKGMRRLEGRSDHRPVIGSYIVYI